MRGLFVTGTDTEVGKTRVSSALVSALRGRGVDAVGMKPIECGGRQDAETLLHASGRSDLALDEINPVFLSEPVAPAAVTPPFVVDLEGLKASFEELGGRADFVVVEGAGGWLVPLDETHTMASLAEVLGLPVLVVAANRLGVLSHTLLTIRAVERSGLDCAGVYLNTIGEKDDPARRTNGNLLARLLPGVPFFEDDLDGLVGALLDSSRG